MIRSLFPSPVLASASMAVLELIPDPALVVTARGGAIVGANLAAVRATGYSRAELQRMSLARLFPEVAWKQLTHAGEIVTFVQPKRLPNMRVRCRVQPWDEEGRYWLIVFPPEGEKFSSSGEKQGHASQPLRPVERAVRQMVMAVSAPDLEQSAQQVLEGSASILSAAWGAVYVLDGPVYRLLAQTGAMPELPQALSLQCSEYFSLQISAPEDAFPTALHRAVQKADAPYLVIAPFEDGNAREGLLVFGYQRLPHDAVLRRAETTALYFREMMRSQSRWKRLEPDGRSAGCLVATGRALLQYAQEGILVFDENLHLVDLSESVADLFGYDKDEMLGAAYAEVLVGEVSLEGAARKALTLGTLQVVEAHLLRRDGTEFPAEIRVAPCALPVNEASLGVMVILNDLSRETQYREQAERLMRRALLGDILASFAHEVRDPLYSISTGLEWLGTLFGDNEEARQPLKNLQEDVGRLDHLVRNLLDYSKARELQLKPLDIVGLIAGIFRRWQRRFERYHIVAEYYHDDDIPLVLGDRLSLEQVFTNLIDNAIHAVASREDERFIVVRISAATSDSGALWVEVNIADNGPGFSPEVTRRLFEPFYTNREGGTGLGLAITKQLVTAHKGSIEAQSYPQSGTIFRVRLRALQEGENGL